MVGQGPHGRGTRRRGTRRGGTRGSRLADEAVQPLLPVVAISPDALWRGTFLLRQGYGGQVLMKPGDFLCLAGEAHPVIHEAGVADAGECGHGLIQGGR